METITGKRNNYVLKARFWQAGRSRPTLIMSSPSSSLSPARAPSITLSNSRPPSRSSTRAPSPGLDDPGNANLFFPTSHSPHTLPVSIRNHMSALKHEIRQKQAQFNSLETTLLRGPRPLPPTSWSPTAAELTSPATTAGTKIQRRTSWDALSAYSSHGPESHIPLPVNGRVGKQDDIREGVPLNFGVSNASLSPRRAGSPTRSMSRT